MQAVKDVLTWIAVFIIVAILAPVVFDFIGFVLVLAIQAVLVLWLLSALWTFFKALVNSTKESGEKVYAY